MNSSKHFLKLLVLAAMVSLAARSITYAQENKKSLSLSDAIAAVLANNKNIQLAKLYGDIATTNYKQTGAVFLPQADLSYTAMSTNNPLNWKNYTMQSFNERFSSIESIAFHKFDDRLIAYLKEKKRLSRSNVIKVSHYQIADELERVLLS